MHNGLIICEKKIRVMMKKLYKLSKLGGGGGGNLDKIPKNSSFFRETVPQKKSCMYRGALQDRRAYTLCAKFPHGT